MEITPHPHPCETDPSVSHTHHADLAAYLGEHGIAHTLVDYGYDDDGVEVWPHGQDDHTPHEDRTWLCIVDDIDAHECGRFAIYEQTGALIADGPVRSGIAASGVVLFVDGWLKKEAR
jgi:hypothetical protein